MVIVLKKYSFLTCISEVLPLTFLLNYVRPDDTNFFQRELAKNRFTLF